MSAIQNVTVGRLNFCTLKGELIDNLIRTVMIRESICTPYITAEIQVMDNDNVINNLQLQGGDPCIVSFESPHPMAQDTQYTAYLKVGDINAGKAKDNIHLKIYTISLLGGEHFVDRGKTITETSNKQENGVTISQRIWAAVGMPSLALNTEGQEDNAMQTQNQAFHVDMVSPLTAIGQIRDDMVYPQWPTGNVLLFASHDSVSDRHDVKLVPLQYLYETRTKKETFIQKETWGEKTVHIFGGDDSYRSIMHIVESSRRSMLNPRDFQEHIRTNDITQGHPSRTAIFHRIAQEGLSKFLHTYRDRKEPETSFASIADRARFYALLLKSFPQYVVEVPFIRGLNITVGDSVFLDLLPSRGLTNPATGNYLVTDLVHELNHDLRRVTGRTILHCLKQGYPGTIGITAGGIGKAGIGSIQGGKIKVNV